MRIAGDGEPYTFSEFQAYYLEAAEDMWQRATPVTATEHDMPPTLLVQSIPAPCASYYEHLPAANPAHIPEHTEVNATHRRTAQAFLCTMPGEGDEEGIDVVNVHAPSGTPKLTDAQRFQLIRNLLQSSSMTTANRPINEESFLIGGDMNTLSTFR